MFRPDRERMYLVITDPNTADSTTWITMPRLITEDFDSAIALARDDKAIERDFIAQVTIFEVDLDKAYKLKDVRRFEDDEREGPIVYSRSFFLGSSRERFYRNDLEEKYALAANAHKPAD